MYIRFVIVMGGIMAVVRFGVSMDSNLLEKFDEVWKERGFVNRSEAFRNIMREFIAERELDKGGEVMGTLSILYSYKTTGVSHRLNEIEHTHWEKIISSMHVHLDQHNCIEVLNMRGRGEEIRKIADSLIGCKGVKQGRLIISPIRIE